MRAERAARTRAAVLTAARERFLADGYAGTTMRGVAQAAGVSVPTVELAFGTKAALLKAAIYLAIAGDDEPVPVLDRPWAGAARAASDPAELLALVAGVLAAAQARSAGLMLALFEGSAGGHELAALRRQMVTQREATAGWLVDRLATVAPLRPGLSRGEAVDTVWALLEPSLYDRLIRHRGWSPQRYERWIAASLGTLLLDPSGPTEPALPTPTPASTTASTPIQRRPRASRKAAP